MQFEIDRRRSAARLAAQRLYGGLQQSQRQKQSSYTGPISKGLVIVVGLVGLVFVMSPAAYAQLTSNTTKLKGTTISTGPPPNSSTTQTSCTSNNNVNVSNSSSQTASSGNATSSGGGGGASSGNASNSNSTSVNINISGC
jgi:hypothetical protein